MFVFFDANDNETKVGVIMAIKAHKKNTKT